MIMSDYNILIETERICLKYGLVKRQKIYFCLPNDIHHFVVEFAYNYLYISTKWKYDYKSNMIVPNNTKIIKFEELEECLKKFMKKYKEFEIKIKKKQIEKDFE